MSCETSYSTGRVKSASGNCTARFVSRLVTPLSPSSKLGRVIKAATEALTLQEQALDVGAKFQPGLATAYQFIQYQSSLAEAKFAEGTAIGVYTKAKAALQKSTRLNIAEPACGDTPP